MDRNKPIVLILRGACAIIAVYLFLRDRILRHLSLKNDYSRSDLNKVTWMKIRFGLLSYLLQGQLFIPLAEAKVQADHLPILSMVARCLFLLRQSQSLGQPL